MVPVLDPSGPIGQQQRDLIILAVVLSAVVVIPVYFMLIFFARKYRHTNKKARYQPHFDRSRLLESIWWGVPLIIITILAVVTFRASHSLEPARPLASSAKPIPIQVVALQWKWLFIYPQQNIASVNYVQFPKDTPVSFEVTADAPMNSLWIPKLGGQIYAMSGMRTKLHLLADETGRYYGQSANISGRGFADMRFTAEATTAQKFEQWVELMRSSPDSLDNSEYQQIAKPGIAREPAFYVLAQPNLFSQIVAKYTGPEHEEH